MLIILLIRSKLINLESDWDHTRKVVRKSSNSDAKPPRKQAAEHSQESLTKGTWFVLCLWLKLLVIAQASPELDDEACGDLTDLAAMVWVSCHWGQEASRAACLPTPELLLWAPVWGWYHSSLLFFFYSHFALKKEEEAILSTSI